MYPASKLSGARWWRGEKRKEILPLCCWNLNSTCNFPVTPLQLSCQVSASEGNSWEFSCTLIFSCGNHLWIPPKTYDVRNRSWFYGTFEFNSYCRAPFNLVVGLLARMFFGCFDHFFKVHQNCRILGCDFCFSRQTLFWTFALHFQEIIRKKVHFSSGFLCDSFHASETKETLFIFYVFSGQNNPHVSFWGSRWRPRTWYH